MKKFQTVTTMNTIGEWVEAFNNNALASSDHTWYLGEMLYNGLLYTGLETIGGVKLSSLNNIDISSKSPQNLELDNFYLYFRDINQVMFLDQVTFDLRPYKDGHPKFFYVNSELGFRVSSDFNQKKNEICLFRFILNGREKFTQCYVTAQRFGSNVYDTADEFFLVKGCMPLPVSNNLRLKLGDGTIKRSGVRFDIHQVPDVHEIEDKSIPFKLRYITEQNKVDFSIDTITDVIPNKILNYSTKAFTVVPDDKFSVQRILYDIYTDCLVIQYGDSMFASMRDALTNINNATFPFPYNTLMFIPLGLMFIKGNCTDLSDPEQCVIVQQLNTTINAGDSAFFAEDNYARGRIKIIQEEVADLQRRVKKLEEDLDYHLHDFNNPHKVTKLQVNLGDVDDLSLREIYDLIFDKGISSGTYTAQPDAAERIAGVNRFLRKDQNDKTNFRLEANELKTSQPYIIVGTRRLYVGCKPSGAPSGSFAIALENQGETQ